MKTWVVSHGNPSFFSAREREFAGVLPKRNRATWTSGSRGVILKVGLVERLTMNRRAFRNLPLIALAGSVVCLVAAGCGSSVGKPTKKVRVPQPGTAVPATYTSAPDALPLATHSSADYQLRPFGQWSEQQAAADALGRIGPPAVPQLVEALHSPDAEVRLQAAQVLARMGSDARDSVPHLVDLLDDPDERIRKTAARTLGRIGPDAGAAVPALMRTLLQPAPTPPPTE
jgi:hypothetical protein